MKQYTACHCLLGIVYIIFDEQFIYALSLQQPCDLMQNENTISSLAKQQLDEYFKGIRKTFSLPIKPEGTPFQKRVWEALCTIPYGETASYKQIAIQVDCPKAARAIGMANNKNPLMIIVPCHRVIGTNGKLVGYAGGLAIKEILLNLEKDNR